MTTPVFDAEGKQVSGPQIPFIINAPSAPPVRSENATLREAVGEQVDPEASAPFDPNDDNKECLPELEAYPVNTGKRRKTKCKKPSWRSSIFKRRKGGKNRTYKVRKTRIKSLKRKTKKNKTKRKK